MKTQILERGKNYKDVKVINEPAIMTGIENFDKFFSKNGGMVLTSTILLTGTSGAGKTTLAVNLQKLFKDITTSLYAREMPESAIKEQTAGLKIQHENAFISDTDSCPTFEEYLEFIYELKPKVVIADSLQVIAREDYPNMSEEDAAYEIIDKLRDYGKKNNAVVFIVGHVTKGNEFRGANTIMQMVDAHLEMIHNKRFDFRTIAWGNKNRKGPAGMLYYLIEDDGIQFFTEDEWDVQKNNIDINNFIVDSVKSYVLSLNRGHENYKAFKEDYNLAVKEIAKNKDLTEIGMACAYVKLVDELVNKHGLINK